MARGEGAWRSLGYRHKEQANVFYFDGHVDQFGLYDFSTRKDEFEYEKEAIKSAD